MKIKSPKYVLVIFLIFVLAMNLAIYYLLPLRLAWGMCIFISLMDNLISSSSVYELNIDSNTLSIKFPTRFLFNRKFMFSLSDIEKIYFIDDTSNGSSLDIYLNSHKKKNIMIGLNSKNVQEIADYLRKYNIAVYIKSGFYEEKLL